MVAKCTISSDRMQGHYLMHVLEASKTYDLYPWSVLCSTDRDEWCGTMLRVSHKVICKL